MLDGSNLDGDVCLLCSQHSERLPAALIYTCLRLRPQGPRFSRGLAAEQSQGSEFKWELYSWQLRRGLTGRQETPIGQAPTLTPHPSGIVGVKNYIQSGSIGHR
ncbi:hypothetical protein NQZ68_032077 [Dissostichus eleginoides]|nr:hypothetical protein NQZ68_032077 [Dissostichus eleginoides]